MFHEFMDEHSGHYELTHDNPAIAKTGDSTLQVPLYRQLKSYTCGFVAAAMVVHSFDRKKSFTKIWEHVTPDFTWGVQTWQLIRGLRKLGIGVSEKYNLTFEDIEESIENGFPVIVTIQRRGIGHWVVIYGVNKKKKELLIAATGIAFISRHRYTWDEFKKIQFRHKEFLICWGK